MREPVFGKDASMTDQLCRNCRWWDGPPNDIPELWGVCQRVWNPETLVRPSDDYGEVETAPDFGCVQWEGKPLSEPPAA